MLHVPASNIDALISQIHVFLQLSLVGPFATNIHLSPLKTLMGMQYFFQKLTQLSQGNNEPDAHASNLDGFLQ
jgi:hypothetical protein